MAVSKANIDDSIQFMNQTVATIYKSGAVPTKSCSQPLFSQGASLPADLKSEWTAAGGEEFKNGILLGLYLPQKSKPNIPSIENSAAIIVRENTNRWTLVHEFMHHLFYIQAKEEGYDQLVSQIELDRALQDFETATNMEVYDSETLSAIVDSYTRIVDHMDEKLIHFTLEEMTIEATLKEAYHQSNLFYVPVTSNYYIYSSGKKALEIYENIEDVGSSLQSALSAKHWMERGLMRAALSKISSRKDKIRSLMADYPDYLTLTGLYSGVVSEAPLHEGCSHETEGNRILQKSRDLKKISGIFKR